MPTPYIVMLLTLSFHVTFIRASLFVPFNPRVYAFALISSLIQLSRTDPQSLASSCYFIFSSKTFQRWAGNSLSIGLRHSLLKPSFTWTATRSSPSQLVSIVRSHVVFSHLDIAYAKCSKLGLRTGKTKRAYTTGPWIACCEHLFEIKVVLFLWGEQKTCLTGEHLCFICGLELQLQLVTVIQLAGSANIMA